MVGKKGQKEGIKDYLMSDTCRVKEEDNKTDWILRGWSLVVGETRIGRF